MVREADHASGGTVALSSIALLQERFRQLQRMKELRQEKELLRMLSETERYSSPPITPNYSYDQFRSTTSESITMFLPDHPKPQYCQLSLSLWPDSQTTCNKHPVSRGKVEAQSNRVKSSSLVCSSSIKLENSGSDHDIDTSLHL
ncbi:hypothetical protein Salat_0280100 [Sesamum alatum]|uniref:Uncharacterized protein n=1 Tax=Sesamum alatum TaxID=300844 RepID=A0AAE1Z039_9LAMI|nr:hypothetical protein Salat_0280100 [Sesamum alatum]